MISVGITNTVNLREIRENAPEGIGYHNLKTEKTKFYNGFYHFPKKLNFDLIESNLPCVAAQNNIQNLNNVIFDFNVFGCSFDRKTRLEIWKNMVLKENCRKIVFMSKAGYNSMAGDYYGKIKDKKILGKSVVVYPAFKEVPDFHKKENDKVNILFTSESFYGDCGEQLVDAFLKLEKEFDIKLTIFAPNMIIPYPKGVTYNSLNHKKIMKAIFNNKNIICNPSGKVENYFRKNDVYIRPPIKDHDGFSLVKAMSYGLPVISTNFFAIPEIVEDNKEGFLIELKDEHFNFRESNNQFYFTKKLQKYLEKNIYDYLKELIEEKNLRKRFGRNALKKARTRFSYGQRNKLMKRIYEEAVR